ncbi:hypothetical protein HYX05_04570 [Candidatus Woesearchaeota archaeon]|nr:hypothetical protein [Candidatus Woesearchaeota archaeon]
MEKSSISFIAMSLALLFVLVGFIIIVFDLSGLMFVFELILLLIFIFLSAFAMLTVHSNEKRGWTTLGATLVLLILDTFFLFLLTGLFGTAHITTIVFSFIALFIVFINLRIARDDESEAVDDEPVKEYYPYAEKPEEKPEISKDELKQEIKEEVKEEVKEEIKKEMEEEKAPEKAEVKKAEIRIKSRKTVMPKFVASAETKKFHTSKCGWARLMKRKNKIFFNSRKRAQKAGFKAHECVK